MLTFITLSVDTGPIGVIGTNRNTLFPPKASDIVLCPAKFVIKVYHTLELFTLEATFHSDITIQLSKVSRVDSMQYERAGSEEVQLSNTLVFK